MKKNDGLTDCVTRKSEKFEKHNNGYYSEDYQMFTMSEINTLEKQPLDVTMVCRQHSKLDLILFHSDHSS